jgi:DNA-binding GntR family transcriptional regulator
MQNQAFKLVRESAPLRKQVRDVLRAEIVSMRFKPGQRLLERELCELTGVSRTVIREALRALEAEGLVNVIPGKGPSVAPQVELEEARGLYETRAVLEGLAGRNFVERATLAERAALRLADRGYVMETGSITLSGLGRELLDDRRVQEAYLGD